MRTTAVPLKASVALAALTTTIHVDQDVEYIPPHLALGAAFFSGAIELDDAWRCEMINASLLTPVADKDVSSLLLGIGNRSDFDGDLQFAKVVNMLRHSVTSEGRMEVAGKAREKYQKIRESKHDYKREICDLLTGFMAGVERTMYPNKDANDAGVAIGNALGDHGSKRQGIDG